MSFRLCSTRTVNLDGAAGAVSGSAPRLAVPFGASPNGSSAARNANRYRHQVNAARVRGVAPRQHARRVRSPNSAEIPPRMRFPLSSPAFRVPRRQLSPHPRFRSEIDNQSATLITPGCARSTTRVLPDRPSLKEPHQNRERRRSASCRRLVEDEHFRFAFALPSRSGAGPDFSAAITPERV